MLGYVQPSVNVSESDGVAQLTVNTAMPSGGVPNEIFLIVNTSDETAIGLEFGFSVLYSPPLYPCFYDKGWNIDSIYSQKIP